jgi:hypothetical protein
LSHNNYFVAWDISDETAANTGRVLLSTPIGRYGEGEEVWWDGKKWKCVGAVRGPSDRDWLVCEPWQ